MAPDALDVGDHGARTRQRGQPRDVEAGVVGMRNGGDDTVEIRNTVVTGSWTAIPVSTGVTTQARGGKMSVYQSSLGQGGQRAALDGSRSREALGASRAIPSAPKRREEGSGSTIR